MNPITRTVAGAGLVLACIAAIGLAVGGAAAGGSEPLGPGEVVVELDVEHSRFSTDRIVVREGTTVRFRVVNNDPINHELIVGTDDVHERHENGTEPFHSPRPGEVSVGPAETAETTYTFDDLGSFEYVCHLPRHRDYGMVGIVEVVPA